MAVEVGPAAGDAAAELAQVATLTFPLACPPSTPAEDIAAFIAANLSERCFTAYLADPARVVLTAIEDERIVGYAMLVRDDPGVQLSKLYVLPDHHGAGVAAALIRAGLGWATGCGASAVWLGVNRNNHRAQAFYRKHGFQVTGTRRFRLGAGEEEDFVMTRPLGEG